MPGDVGAVYLQGLFVQRARHQIVVGELDKGIAHLLDAPLGRSLAHKDGTDGEKSDHHGEPQQKMLEQIIILRVGQHVRQPPADGYENAYEHRVGQFIRRRYHDDKKVAHRNR